MSVDGQADFPDRGRILEMPDHLLLTGAQILGCQLWQNGNTCIGLHHTHQGFYTTCLVMEIFVVTHLFAQLA
jgi:hypothetical protein